MNASGEIIAMGKRLNWGDLPLKVGLVGILFAILLLFSCSGGTRGPIREEKMEAILYEMYIARSVVVATDSLGQKAFDCKLDTYAPILCRHGHTMDEFDSMLSIYSTDPKRLDALLDRIIARMEEERESLLTSDTLRDDMRELKKLELEHQGVLQ